MSKRVNKPIIGKDIDRTSSLITEGASQNIAEGEVVVLDKYKTLLTAGSTVADSDVIYLAVGTGETHDYTLPNGTAVTGIRKLSYSAPIQGSKVLSYKGISADSGAVERQATIDMSGITPVVGTEYVLRIVYKDLVEHPGQFTQTFRHISTDATIANLVNAFVTKINAYGPSGNIDSRVTASNSSNDLVLVGRVIPSNDTNDEIDEYNQVDFEISVWSIVTSTGVQTNSWSTATITYNTTASSGNGNPKKVRDIEKFARAYEGVTNLTHFPVIKPAMSTDMTKWYDSITIEHDVEYVSADNQYVKEAPLTTQVFIPAAALQTDDVLAVLNPWMASVNKTAVTL